MRVWVTVALGFFGVGLLVRSARRQQPRGAASSISGRPGGDAGEKASRDAAVRDPVPGQAVETPPVPNATAEIDRVNSSDRSTDLSTAETKYEAMAPDELDAGMPATHPESAHDPADGLLGDLSRLPREPLFGIAKDHGLPVRRLIMMSRDELIDAIAET